ncbi:AMP-binding protein [Acetanaerobacterium elongatum]|uniref:D-alanine--poly(Phosphoribitol) ligase subunit 1 n=1 Tax=Acetanaerobacterium elongatum TaxID=258515 RepID=A0A1G9ZUB7_9FIRM|nr:AMP-binding protein [Acetanaerobacterium elongatum]SDN24717.1 D-alanine--poly(phosphoribitol) ligase subunit 1 [Acetanaerobacterium elongatum]
MLLQQILENCRLYPNRTAYSSQQGCLSYDALVNAALAVAEAIRQASPGEEPVLVYGHKQPMMPVCFLACLLLGRAYVPADSGTPPARIKQMAEQAGCTLLLAVEELEIRGLPSLALRDMESACIKQQYPARQFKEPSADSLAYILFTSGSTGMPKGVMVSYGNLDGFIEWLRQLPAIRETDCAVVLNQAAFSFDLSAADIYLAFSTGRTLFVLEKTVQQDYPLFFSRLKESGAGIAVMTPSFAELCLADELFNERLLPNLRCIFFCGETLHPVTVQRLKERFTGLRVINAYGPTEATVAVTATEIDGEMVRQQRLSLGCAREKTHIIIVDEALAPLPNGETGQILIVGSAVAKGYAGGLQGGFMEYNGLPAYLTGDYGFLKNAELYFSGRADTQVKRGGYRIELQDIEQNLNQQDGVAKSAVVAEEKGGRLVLHAFVQPKADSDTTATEVRRQLAQRLPAYMLPNRIHLMVSLPLTANGKCDRMALKMRLNREEG